MPVEVKVRYYAGLRELTGRAEEIFRVEEGTTLGDLLLRHLPERYPRARKRILELLLGPNPGEHGLSGRYLILVNGKSHNLLPGQLDYELKDGDVITMFPPLGGG